MINPRKTSEHERGIFLTDHRSWFLPEQQAATDFPLNPKEKLENFYVPTHLHIPVIYIVITISLSYSIFMMASPGGAVGSYQSKCSNQSPSTTMSTDASSPDSEYTSAVPVNCNVAELKENEMKQVDFDEDTRVLVVKQNDRLLAVGAKCTHYGAPLQTGARAIVIIIIWSGF